MNSKLPMKYKKSFISKVKKFFFNLFNKQDIAREEINISDKKEILSQKEENNLFQQYRTESKNHKLREEIVEIIDNNPDMIEHLSIKQLEELSNIYDEQINENNKKITRLEKTILRINEN